MSIWVKLISDWGQGVVSPQTVEIVRDLMWREALFLAQNQWQVPKIQRLVVVYHIHMFWSIMPVSGNTEW